MLGLYPTWFEPGVGSGWIIGFIATIHVLFSHASVGGAVLFAWLANFAVRRDKPAYLAFIRRYGLFLLIFSYVLGSITGPGIWFAATIASPPRRPAWVAGESGATPEITRPSLL